MTQETSNCKSGFNYCFCAKFIVGVPAIFIIAYAAASFFTHPLLQMAAAVGASLLAVFIAIKIDNMPALSGKIVKKD